MLISSSYLTCGLETAHVQSLGNSLQASRVKGGWGCPPVGFQRPTPSMLSVGWRWTFGGGVIGEWWSCWEAGGRWALTWTWLLAFLPIALLTAPCPLNMTAWHWSFSGHKPLWDQNDTHGDKHYPVPLLLLPDSLSGTRIGCVHRILFLSSSSASKCDSFNDKGDTWARTYMCLNATWQDWWANKASEKLSGRDNLPRGGTRIAKGEGHRYKGHSWSDFIFNILPFLRRWKGNSSLQGLIHENWVWL